MDGETVRDVMIRAISDASYPYPTGAYDPAFVVITPESITEAITAALAAHGMKVVAREPTPEMLQDGRDAARRVRIGGVCGMTIDSQIRAECAREGAAWRAMHDAAPPITEKGDAS